LESLIDNLTLNNSSDLTCQAIQTFYDFLIEELKALKTEETVPNEPEKTTVTFYF
jgi:hypothetical protein